MAENAMESGHRPRNSAMLINLCFLFRNSESIGASVCASVRHTQIVNVLKASQQYSLLLISLGMTDSSVSHANMMTFFG